MPIVAYALTHLIDVARPLDLTQDRTGTGHLILGGGTRRNAPEYHGDTLGRLLEWVPSIAGLDASHYALYEMLGYAVFLATT